MSAERLQNPGPGRPSKPIIAAQKTPQQDKAMCTRYETVSGQVLGALFGTEVGYRVSKYVEPGQTGLMVRRASIGVEVVAARWGLIPWFSKTSQPSHMAKEAKFESIATAASFKNPWLRGQRCIVIAASFEEPNWDGNKHCTWSFRRADGDVWGLAGIWNSWRDPEGRSFESFALLMVDAHRHPVMSQVNNTRPIRENHWDEKRSVVALERNFWNPWLSGTVDEAKGLVHLASPEIFVGHAI